MISQTVAITPETMAQAIGVQILTPAETALATTLSESTLAKMRLKGGSGNLPFVKMGKRVGYRPEDVAAWLQSRIRQSTSQAA
jgi:predicted DNA-binding transcriptional regulator AlpA